MNYTVNWKNVHFPLWFYPTLKNLMEKWSQKNTQWLEYVSALSRDKYVKEINFLSQARMEEIGREAWPFLIYTYK